MGLEQLLDPLHEALDVELLAGEGDGLATRHDLQEELPLSRFTFGADADRLHRAEVEAFGSHQPNSGAAASGAPRARVSMQATT